MCVFSIDTQSSLALLCLLLGLRNQNPKLITLFSLQNRGENWNWNWNHRVHTRMRNEIFISKLDHFALIKIIIF